MPGVFVEQMKTENFMRAFGGVAILGYLFC
jgi:hypothetical protein